MPAGSGARPEKVQVAPPARLARPDSENRAQIAPQNTLPRNREGGSKAPDGGLSARRFGVCCLTPPASFFQGDIAHWAKAVCCRGEGAAAISAISFLTMALPNALKSSATITKAPGPPMTLSR
jgi:hypothetical protein